MEGTFLKITGQVLSTVLALRKARIAHGTGQTGEDGGRTDRMQRGVPSGVLGQLRGIVGRW